jgi:WD40 repeat protein
VTAAAVALDNGGPIADVVSMSRLAVPGGGFHMKRWHVMLLVLLFFGPSTQQDDALSHSRTAPAPPDRVPPIAAATEEFHWRSWGGAITFLDFSPADDRLVAAIGVENDARRESIVVLNISDTKEVYRCEAIFPMTICFSPDGTHLAVLAADAITLHDLSKKQVCFRADRSAVERDTSVLGFTADSSTFVAAAEYLDPEKKKYAWNTTTGESSPVPTGAVVWKGRGLAPDGTMFLSGGWPGPTPRIYKTDGTGRITYCYREVWPFAALFSPDSRNVVTIHRDGLLVVWEIKPTDNDNARQLATATGFDDCRAIAVSHDRNWLATADSRGIIRIDKFPAE